MYHYASENAAVAWSQGEKKKAHLDPRGNLMK